MDGNFQNYIHIFRSMSTCHRDSLECQTSLEANPKRFVSEHFRMCKAKLQKRKFIQRQNKEQLGLYKQKMLRLVKKRSSESVDQASKRIAGLESQLKFEQEMESIVSWIRSFQNKIRQCPIEKQHEAESLILECKSITLEIEARNNAQLHRVAEVADKIQQICLESILQ